MTPSATATVTPLPAVPASKGLVQAGFTHPLAPLSPREHAGVVSLVSKQLRPNAWFKYLQIKEPAKALLAPWLDAFHANGQRLPLTPPLPPRVAELCFTVPKTAEVHSCDVDLATMSITRHELLEKGSHAPLDPTQMETWENFVLASPIVKQCLGELGLPEDTKVACDPWIYGSDQEEVEPSYMQFLMYLSPPNAAGDPDAFHYAYPLPFVPRVNLETEEIDKVEWCYTGDSADGMKYTWKENFDASAFVENEYMPHLQKDYKPRTDLKALIVEQPEGPSFNVVEDRTVEWQKWRFTMSWNAREGLVLHDVRYDDRSLFYRLSVSEMTVPYSDNRPPFHRKQAFDLGDAGAGLTANSLNLGCDCLGYIKYFDGEVTMPDGKLLKQKNVVCCHEQDMGIGMKHTNYRTQNPYVTRNRQLVLQTIITVANYEYVFMWYFDQAGAIHHEVRATGVLSVSPIDKGKVSPYGNVVAPSVLAPNHQHIFCLRIHPRIQGDGNTLIYEESKTMPFETEEDRRINPFGTGYTVEKTTLEREGFSDLNAASNRTFKIVNPKEKNRISQRPMGYKLHLPQTQLLLAHPDSVAAKRAPFATHHVWVSNYRESELWAGGQWTNQSKGKAGGLDSYTAKAEPTTDSDIVVWAVFGLTHNPRVEDFPIMPVENIMVSLKPADFFEKNPAMDVPVSNQVANKSVEHPTPTQSCCPSKH